MFIATVPKPNTDDSDPHFSPMRIRIHFRIQGFEDKNLIGLKTESGTLVKTEQSQKWTM